MPSSPRTPRPRLTVSVGEPRVLELIPRPATEPPAEDTPRDEGAVDVQKIYDPDEPHSKVAVLVCHGMGQQVPFETLNSVASTLAGEGTGEMAVRHVRIGETCFPRAEVTVKDPEGRDRAVHVYESHWAPVMEGRVSARDVTRFLFSAGFAGVRHALAGSFDRWMFGRRHHLPISPYAVAGLLAAFTFIVSGLVLYATLAFVAVAKAGEFLFLPKGSPGSWNGAPVVDALTLELFCSPLIVSLVATPLMLWFKQRPTKSEAPRRAGTTVARVAVSLLVLAAAGLLLWWTGAVAVVARGGWTSLAVGIAIAAAVGAIFLAARVLARRGRLGIPLTVVFAVVIAWTIRAAVMVGVRLGQWVDGDIEAGWATSLTGWRGTLMKGADTPFYLVFLACSVVLCVAVRWFYIQYFGDVAAYLSSHTVNKFHEVRGQIKAIGLQTARAVYGARRPRHTGPEYDRVLVVGHSLGSVVAYDTLNAVLNEDATGAGLDVLGRTGALVTFGSPLDKSAFVFRAQVQDAEGREALAAAVQPLIHPGRGRGRTTPWFNLYSPYDPISGPLNFYDPPRNEQGGLEKHEPVENIADPEADLPAVAHTQYWENRALADLLQKLVTAPIPNPAAPAAPAQPAREPASVA